VRKVKTSDLKPGDLFNYPSTHSRFIIAVCVTKLPYDRLLECYRYTVTYNKLGTTEIYQTIEWGSTEWYATD